MFKSNSNSYKILVGICSVVITATIGYLIVRGGDLNPSSAPGDTMKTLDDIYYRLDKDASVTSSWGLDSSAAPTSTMYTLQEIFDKTPDFHDDPGSVTSGNVCNSATFYSSSSAQVTGTRTYCAGCADGTAETYHIFAGKTADIDCDAVAETGTAGAVCFTIGYTSCTAFCATKGLSCQGNSGGTGITCMGNKACNTDNDFNMNDATKCNYSCDNLFCCCCD